MSVDGSNTETHNEKRAQPVENARAALVNLLNAKKLERPLSQEVLAKKLRKEIEALQALNVSATVIHAHLKISGIKISKKALGEVMKKKTRKVSGRKANADSSKE